MRSFSFTSRSCWVINCIFVYCILFLYFFCFLSIRSNLLVTAIVFYYDCWQCTTPSTPSASSFSLFSHLLFFLPILWCLVLFHSFLCFWHFISVIEWNIILAQHHLFLFFLFFKYRCCICSVLLSFSFFLQRCYSYFRNITLHFQWYYSSLLHLVVWYL